MPDLMTHILVPSLFKRKFGKYFSIVVLGAVLPDFVTRIPCLFLEIFFPNHSYQWNWFFQIFHSLIPLLFFCLLIAFLFEEKERKSIIKFLLIGTVSHVFLDLFQKHFTLGTQGYHWLFPLTWQDFTIPLFWPETSLYFIPVILIAFVLLNFRDKFCIPRKMKQ